METRDAGRRRGPRRHPRPLCARKIHQLPPDLSASHVLAILPFSTFVAISLSLQDFPLSRSIFHQLSVRPSFLPLPFFLFVSVSRSPVTGSSDDSVSALFFSAFVAPFLTSLPTDLLHSLCFSIPQGVHARESGATLDLLRRDVRCSRIERN